MLSVSLDHHLAAGKHGGQPEKDTSKHLQDGYPSESRSRSRSYERHSLDVHAEASPAEGAGMLQAHDLALGRGSLARTVRELLALDLSQLTLR